MPIPSYADWKAKTHQTRFGFQTGEFKRLDAALKTYDLAKTEPNKTALKNALDAWIAKEPGFEWKKSMRNESGLIEQLHTALNPYRAAPQGWVAPTIPANPAPGTIHLGQSFANANSKERNDVPKAFERAKALIFRAYTGIVQARTAGGKERQIYERWFGVYDANRFSTVFNNIRALHDALNSKPVVLYYRGDKVSGPTDCDAETGNLAPPAADKQYFGAAWKPQHLPPELDKKFTYIFLGELFFSTSSVFSQDSIAGVIIHELSHSICGTDDVIYKGGPTYGADACKVLATEKPQLAVHNADSYEYLCENYQNALFVPKKKVLNLPAKASISLNLTPPK